MTLGPSANTLHLRIKQQREGTSSFILDVDLQIPSVGVT
ncbi:MAG: molybdate transport system ATP-binding protein, partial [Marinomonas primoryensis]